MPYSTKSQWMKQIIILAVAAVSFVVVSSASDPNPSTPKSVELTGLHNAFKIDDQLYSGSSPVDETPFDELARLGVKAIISVDGSKPKVELARKHGMRYIHLPVGYDGLPKQRIAELIKAAETAKGAVYIHCHHGKHRGPAAVAAVCQGLRGWTPETATTWLKQAGTSNDYAGLYRDIREFQKPDAKTLASIPDQLPEIAPTPTLVDAMVTIDDHNDRLKSAQAVEWREIPGEPDLTPVQSATLLWESFRELTRDPSTSEHGKDYATKLGAAEKTAEKLMQALKQGAKAERDAAFKAVMQDCATCHKAHRN
jgi:protein tyrosine phosphatase (PTP) superfamily phosphohydrolase (DUF442 family)